MKYSVVICSYNKLEYLKIVVSALQSIGGGHQYILSDDGSTDGTAEWSSNCGFFSNIFRKDKNTGYGLCAARNAGIRLASESHVVLLDADCMPENTYFEGHDSIFERHVKSISVGFTNFYEEDGKKKLYNDHRLPWLAGKEVMNMGWMSAYGGNIAFSKNVWDQVGGFDERYDGSWGLEDADFAYMAIKAGVEIYAERRSVVRHLRHPLTGTHEMRIGKGPNTKKFIEKHGFNPC